MSIEDYITRVVNQAPPLTEAQRRRLAPILRTNNESRPKAAPEDSAGRLKSSHDSTENPHPDRDALAEVTT